jgi:hypothetical protein
VPILPRSMARVLPRPVPCCLVAELPIEPRTDPIPDGLLKGERRRNAKG